MSFTDAIKTCFRKYATFSGRARRPEYWWFALFLFIGSVVLGFIDGALFGTVEVERAPGVYDVEVRSVLGRIFALATLIPALAVGWRRMHDTGRSGLFLLYPLIVMVGITTFLGFAYGFRPLFSGEFGALIGGGVGLIALLAALVLFISPLLVLWWLTRPTQPHQNQWGPVPPKGAR